jgi:hypothetical protein
MSKLDAHIARQAHALMSNPATGQAFDELEADYIRRWRNTAPEAVQQREHWYASLKAVETVRARLTSYASEAAEHA